MKKKIIVIILAAALAALLIWGLWTNKALEVNTYVVSCDRLPAAFNGYRIAQVSDLHNDTFGKNNEKLLTMLAETNPDMIAITGDLIDSRDTDVEIALDFVREAVKIAPCYYVSGNHEARVLEYGQLKEGLEELDVTLLEDAEIKLEREGEIISVIGVDDPSFETDYLFGDSGEVMDRKLQDLAQGEDYTVLLSHRPELLDVYAAYSIDLVLSGHAHGGQFRLPFVSGLFAPNQGLFPKYDAGLYKEGSTHMIVSRGVGNSLIPLRFNNRPEVILVELQNEKAMAS